MSTCPTKDIHSLYLDDEMPQVYKKEYELHLESCEKCRNELAKLKAMKLLFKQDADSVSLDKSQLDQSYERLMVKMNYSKNSKKSSKFTVRNFVYAASSIAAVAIFAFIIPLAFNSSKSGAVKTMTATSSMLSQASVQVPSQMLTSTNVSLAAERGMLISGNLSNTDLPKAPSDTLITNVSNSYGSDLRLIRDVDILSPTFEENKTISIRITVPGINADTVTTEIALPVDVTGNN